MRRKITAIALLISFVAMATSGLLMFWIEKPSFTIRMHPVHKLFGLIMVAAAISHIGLNGRSVLAYMKQRSMALVAGALTALLVLTYAVVIMQPIPPELATPLDEAAQRAENHGAAAE